MCDPFTAGIIGAIGSIGSAVMNYSAQSSYQKAQEDANNQWVAYQRRQSQEAQARDEANRQKAQLAQQQTLEDISGQKQMQQQQTEETRLTKELTPEELASREAAGTTTAGDALLTGQTAGAATPVRQAIADQISGAAKDARQRIAALATIQSYGPSQFGLQNYVNKSLQTGNQQIDLANDYRRGDLAAYQVAKQVEPLKYYPPQSGANLFGGIANSLASVAGRGLTTQNLVLPAGVV